MGGPGSGRRKGGGKSSLSKSGGTPGTFSVSISKMRAKKMPKEIKKAGINSSKYKKWVYDNWKS